MVIEYLNPFNTPTLQGTLTRIETPAGNAFFLYLPPNYHADETKTSYPILYHLHGAGSMEFMTKKDIAWTAQQNELYDSAPMIIVAPIGPSFSMWADGNQDAACTMVLEDVLPFVESDYSVDTSRRYLQGFSMGGFGVASWAFKFPNKFAKVIVWDGALHDFDTLTTNRAFIAKNQFGNDPKLFDKWSPWKLSNDAAEHGTMQQAPPILMFSGSMAATRSFGDRFAKHLKDKGASYEYVQTEFAHCMKPFMDAYGKKAFEFLSSEA